MWAFLLGVLLLVMVFAFGVGIFGAGLVMLRDYVRPKYGGRDGSDLAIGVLFVALGLAFFVGLIAFWQGELNGLFFRNLRPEGCYQMHYERVYTGKGSHLDEVYVPIACPVPNG